jgi:hypothetical protein
MRIDSRRPLTLESGKRQQSTNQKARIMIKVEIYINQEFRDKSFGLNASIIAWELSPGYRKVYTPGSHPLVKVFEFAELDCFDGDLDVCEYVFSEFNIGTGNLASAYRSKRQPSLSVGDVVSIERMEGKRFYSCEFAGFRFRDIGELNIIQEATV